MSAGPGDEDDSTERTTETAGSDAETPEGSERFDSQSVDPNTPADDEWRFSLDDLPDSGEGDGQSGNVAGTLETRQPLEPGDIDPENAFFVLVGVCLVAGLIVGALLGF